MKTQLRRFAILAVVGSVLASALVAGCGGSSSNDDSGTAANAGGAKGASNSTGASNSAAK